MMIPHPGQQVLIENKLPAKVLLVDHERQMALVEIRGKQHSQAEFPFSFLSALTLAERRFREFLERRGR